MRYVYEYIDGLFVVVCSHFLRSILSCDQISCKSHMVGGRMHKVFGLTGLEL